MWQAAEGKQWRRIAQIARADGTYQDGCDADARCAAAETAYAVASLVALGVMLLGTSRKLKFW